MVFVLPAGLGLSLDGACDLLKIKDHLIQMVFVLPAGLGSSLDGACDLPKIKDHLIQMVFVLPAGLEPATYCSASKRSNPLSYGSVV